MRNNIHHCHEQEGKKEEIMNGAVSTSLAVAGVGINSSCRNAEAGDPIPYARLLYGSLSDEFSRADSNGVIRFGIMVQDQGL